MKAITKLIFALLLIGIVLSLPKAGRASSGTEGWTCNWSAYGACYNSLQQWMAGCTRDCTEDGGSPQFTCYDTYQPYTIVVTDPNTGEQTTEVVPYWTTDCESVPANGADCVNTCVNQYNGQYNACLNDNCTPAP
jgi:hypothetical protein